MTSLAPVLSRLKTLFRLNGRLLFDCGFLRLCRLVKLGLALGLFYFYG